MHTINLPSRFRVIDINKSIADTSTCLERSNHGSNGESIQIYGSHTLPKWRTAYVSRPIETITNEASTYIFI